MSHLLPEEGRCTVCHHCGEEREISREGTMSVGEPLCGVCWSQVPKENAESRKGTFSLGESPSFPGITFGETWNGFACPFFPLESVRKISEHFAQFPEAEQVFVDDDGAVMFEDESQREYETLDGKEEISRNWEEVSPRVVDGVAYYGIGYSSWVWNEDESE